MNLLAIKFGSRHDASKSFFRGRDGNIGRAHAAADEGKHEDQAGDPEVEDHGEVVVHGPPEANEGVGERAHANVVVLAEQHRGGHNLQNELAQARDERAVDGAHSSAEPPGANEHEERVQSNYTIGGSHEDSDDGEGGATLLAVHITVFGKVHLSCEEIVGKLVIGPVDSASNLNFDIPSLVTEGRLPIVSHQGLTRAARD